MNKLYICLFMLFFCIVYTYAQSSLTDEETETIEEITGNSANVQAFRGIALGMSLEQVKDILKDDPYFNYHGDPDTYILPAKEQSLLECTGNSYIKRAYFQFHDNKLYIMIVELNQDKIDFYTLFNTLTKKYGKYSSFSPEVVMWLINEITLILERPVSVKYIDRGVFNSLKEQGRLEKTSEILGLEKFLEQF